MELPAWYAVARGEGSGVQNGEIADRIGRASDVKPSVPYRRRAGAVCCLGVRDYFS